jgi:hypothetical protein
MTHEKKINRNANEEWATDQIVSRKRPPHRPNSPLYGTETSSRGQEDKQFWQCSCTLVVHTRWWLLMRMVFPVCFVRIQECRLKAVPYSVANWRLHHIHEPDVTSSLKGKKGARPFSSWDLISSGFFLLEEYIKNSEGNVDHSEQSVGQPPSPCH